MRPYSRSRCSRGKSVMKTINLPWTDGRDVHYPTEEPNPAHVESLGRGKTHPNFLDPSLRFGAQIVPPRTPHGISDYSGPTLVYSPWLDLIKPNNLKYLRFPKFPMEFHG